MARRRERYSALYEGDFGLSALAEKLFVAEPIPDEAQSLRLASELAAFADGEGAVELGVDVRCLLGSPLPDNVLRTAWLAATHGRFDPAACESGVRGWLRRLAEHWPERERGQPLRGVGGVEPVEGGPGPGHVAAPGGRLPLSVRHGLDRRQDPLGLTVDATEHDVLADQLSRCPDAPITVTLAR
ncbi:hypothetical protein [Streptomyces sennicomposti]